MNIQNTNRIIHNTNSHYQIEKEEVQINNEGAKIPMKGIRIHTFESSRRKIPESADNFEFSAKRLSENAKTINSEI